MQLIPNKHVRRNILELKKDSPAEFGRFMAALRNLETSDDWPRICGIHGNTFNPKDSEVLCPTDPEVVEKIGNTPDEPFYCAHSETKFIAWHTPYIYQFELLLNKHNQSENKDYIPLPYLWLTNGEHDYSFTYEKNITILLDGENIVIENPLAAENVSYYDTKGVKHTVTRNGFLQPTNKAEVTKINTTNRELNNVMYADRYPTFSSNTVFNQVLKKLIDFNPLEIPHNNVHDFIGGIGGIMGDVAVSAYDPLFWLHHCNMDRFFYNWLFVKTEGFNYRLLPQHIPEDTLHGTLAPFQAKDVYSDNYIDYAYGWQNDTMEFLKIENTLEFHKFPYTYEKINIKPYMGHEVTVEICGMPIPMESMHIEVLLHPKDNTVTPENRHLYVAGSSTWFGINRHLKNCKRCNRSRTNMKIGLEEYLRENNIDKDELQNYTWVLEGSGRLHSDDQGNYKTYSQEEIVQDGVVELLIHQ